MKGRSDSSLIAPRKLDVGLQTLGFISQYSPRRFSDAVAELTQTSLVTRDAASRHLSTIPLVRTVLFYRLSESERTSNFDLAVRILCSEFPSTWKDEGPQQGHGRASWKARDLALPHVRRLRARFEKHHIKSTIPDVWAELLLRTGT